MPVLANLVEVIYKFYILKIIKRHKLFLYNEQTFII